MLHLFGILKHFLKRRPEVIDNAVFRLHWMFTSSLLMVFSIMITAKQYVGQPIACMEIDNIPEEVINAYCWIHTTFAVPEAFHKEIGVEVPYPGIDNSKNGAEKHYAYYQWVCFVLFLQAILFYTPYYIWKIWEGGLITALSMGMNVAVISEEEKGKKRKIVTNYLSKHKGMHKLYALKYVLCECLCLINVVGQMWLMNIFLDGEFFSYGVKVVQFVQMNQEERVDPMIFIFPRMTKCRFHQFGYSGDVQKHDVLCILPLNIVNEKIYIFIWFWFIILTILTIVVLISRLVVLIFRRLRSRFLQGRCRLAAQNDLQMICRHCDFGDWFLLYMLTKNVDPVVVQEVTSELAGNERWSGEEDAENLVV
ncbi:innexin shaking-B-like [Limulus polyphemus]|uniref:Innexin n=1 Tax=Limulus polyphemus TaxID=6850 RepID=A0ABM1BEI5_LIMPO|nr:innexin shaking-B-like [Limulus polyphemus]